MAGPSNIRINPFTGTGGATNYVELTEKHIIPAVSPYVIRLNEVPEKQDPSNMKMVYVDSATGAVTENVLTEVAATPGQGEFRADYSTNAMEDKTWNTGLIEFSASDAGKIVQVTYTGTGTLAGVTSNTWPSWYTDRGDGSDGDFVSTENTTLQGTKNYKRVFIKSGITITVNKYLHIKCLEGFVNNGKINGKGKGSTGGTGSNGGNGKAGTAGLSTVGGAGGSGDGNYTGGAGGGNQNETSSKKPAIFEWGYGAGGGGGACGGSSGGITVGKGGNGGAGGGCISITANTFANTGTIDMSGANGNEASTGASRYGGGGGGGAGGTIDIIANSISKGTLLVKGGAGGTGAHNGADGSDGILNIVELGV